MHLLLSVVTMVTCLQHVTGRIQELPVPDDIQQCFRHVQERAGLDEVLGENVIARCVHGVLWSNVKDTPNMAVPEATVKWFSELVDRTMREARRTRFRRQGRRVPLRIRKEIRVMPDWERNLFHRAVLMLKADTSVSPNIYDALGRMHFHLSDRAHMGPNFLGWHRLFLIVVENALREKIPTVTIPYWDSTLDSELRDPRASIIWSPEFLGNGNGFVTTGPYRNWITPMGPLLRNFDDGGAMMNWTSIEQVLTMKHLENITFPAADPKFNLEEQHNEIHRWVGGHMAPQPLAAFDPVFYLLHSFVDLVWELFRREQRKKGVDPTRDYPMHANITAGHRYTDASGIGNLLNRHSLSDIFMVNIYAYQLPPSCHITRPDCGSTRLKCKTGVPKSRCASATVFDTPQLLTAGGIPMHGSSGIREVRSTRHRNHSERYRSFMEYVNNIRKASSLQCQAESVNEHVINNFYIDGVVDRSAWAYISVETIYRQAARDRNGSSMPAVRHKCNSELPPLERVFVESTGINYRGNYKEVVHVPKGLPTSSDVTFVGVKSPGHNDTEVYISAYDSCGRACRPFCLNKADNRYRRCSGAVLVTRDTPLLYGSSEKELVTDMWADTRSGLPELDTSQIFMKMLCDDSSEWPW